MRPIDAEALDEKAIEMSDTCVYVPIEAIWNAPTITPESLVRHGRWRWCGEDRWNDAYECSECGKIHTDDSSYCPNCGAKMDIEE